MVQPDLLNTTKWNMRIACWITKDINTHSEYIIFIAFRLQQWLHERISMVRYVYTACLVVLMVNEQSVNNAVFIVRFHGL